MDIVFSIAPSFVEAHDEAELKNDPGRARMIATRSACNPETPTAKWKDSARTRG